MTNNFPIRVDNARGGAAIWDADYLGRGLNFYVTADLRKPYSGFDESNCDYADQIEAIARERGIPVRAWGAKEGSGIQFDPESCQLFVNTETLEQARQVADICAEVVS